jgi:CBS domain containing-hemolysin-like protein
MTAIIVLLIMCAFFNASEMAFVSCDWIKLRSWARRNRRGAKSALASLRNLDKLLTTTLVGTNLAVVGLSVIASNIYRDRLPEPLIILFVGLMIFVFGEILPKSVASRTKEQLAITLAKPYSVMYWMFFPLMFVAYRTSLMVLRSLRLPTPAAFHKFTREDIRIVSRKTLPLREYNIVSRLLDFRGRQTKEIMIPHDRILAVPVDVSLEQLKQIVSMSGYSRIPMYRWSINEIVGVVHAKSLLTASRVEDAIRPCAFIDEEKTIESLFEELKDKESFFAIVKDKRGKTLGLVTMEDVFEELFGEIEDEYDKIHS